MVLVRERDAIACTRTHTRDARVTPCGERRRGVTLYGIIVTASLPALPLHIFRALRIVRCHDCDTDDANAPRAQRPL